MVYDERKQKASATLPINPFPAEEYVPLMQYLQQEQQ